ncbi:ubiquitin-like protein [Bimuria novae-zelandiae CBS 107.79]|uniref:Ubiquitin-like protein n=1 Tax=Bimuria novae-zelandiae CBS 107.79 TaxID=1447943 RepID=A0A6A5UX20_9PLEO|nr:ubiquitin-like protein [Bimuria novae-zelandiae CBS 107.79]
MNIVVTTSDGRKIPFTTRSDDTIESLRNMIHGKEGMPPGLQRLIFGGRQLDDGHTLADYNIRHRDTVLLQLNMGIC